MPLGAASSNYFIGVELLTGNGGLPAYPSLPNSEYYEDYLGSESASDNVRVSPALRSRVRIGFGPGPQQAGDGVAVEFGPSSWRIAISPCAGINPLQTTGLFVWVV
jgi:hypothetical protein